MNTTLLTALLVNAREEAGITQYGLAKLLGAGRTSVVEWETGHGNPHLSRFVAWADALGYDVTLTAREGDAAPVSGRRAEIRWRPGKAAS